MNNFVELFDKVVMKTRSRCLALKLCRKAIGIHRTLKSRKARQAKESNIKKFVDKEDQAIATLDVNMLRRIVEDTNQNKETLNRKNSENEKDSNSTLHLNPVVEKEIFPVKIVSEGENDATIPKLFEDNEKPVTEEVILPVKIVLEGENDATVPRLFDKA